MDDEELAALKRIGCRPLYLHRGVLPSDAPSARVLASLEAKQLIRVIGNDAYERWALTSRGLIELRRWKRASKD